MSAPRPLLCLTLALIVLLVGCASPPPVLLDGLGSHQRPVTTASLEARQFFHQGLVLCHGFNHDEAVAAFEHAARLDDSFALAHWGVAFALGPNINSPMTDVDKASRAYAESRRAEALMERATPVEQALIGALLLRYADPAPEDRTALDQAYADALRAAWVQHSDDADVGTLLADALLNLSPWDQWDPDGTPKPNTLEILEVLEAVLAFAPDHPFANHLHIHATEASQTPERAEASADRLLLLAPGQGHLVHMPSHTYMRVGRYADAAEANRRALIADNAYFALRGPQHEYELYRAHNYHFRAYAAMFQGDREAALIAAAGLVHDLPRWAIETMPQYAEGFLAVPWHVMVRFGLWQQILDEPEPDTPLTIADALWHYARGVAFANLGRIAEAQAETALFEADAAFIGEGDFVALSEAEQVVVIARHMLAGELLYRQGKLEQSFAQFMLAVAADDALKYGEPRGWMQPVRHAYGALLLESGQAAEAEQIYRQDLERHPENGWSLHGLAEALRVQGQTAEADAVQVRFEAAWEAASIDISASCFCRRT